MRQNATVSRRKLVLIAAGAAATAGVSAVASARAIATATQSENKNSLAANRERIFSELVRVRQASGHTRRGEAFASLAAAIRLHHVAGLSLDDASGTLRRNGTTDATALYRGREPEAVLAQVIVRELESRPVHEPAWMTRFADLEAVIRAGLG